MAMNNIQFQENVSATMQDLQTQFGQLATTMNQLQSKGFGQLSPHSTSKPPPPPSPAVELKPLSSMVQPLHAPLITTNKLQVEQKEKLLQDLKKLRDFYEHIIKHSTLRFLLKKPPKDVTLEVLRWMRKRLPQLITTLKWKTMITLTLGAKGALELFWEWVLHKCGGDTPRRYKWYIDSLACAILLAQLRLSPSRPTEIKSFLPNRDLTRKIKATPASRVHTTSRVHPSQLSSSQLSSSQLAESTLPTEPKLGVSQPKRGAWPRRSCPGQTNFFPTQPNLKAQDTPAELVHGASVRHLVDRRGAGLEFGKPKLRLSLVSLSETEFSPTLSESHVSVRYRVQVISIRDKSISLHIWIHGTVNGPAITHTSLLQDIKSIFSLRDNNAFLGLSDLYAKK
ncbi:hypothetical protein CR513_21491, partial [Mucuna pruriens]